MIPQQGESSEIKTEAQPDAHKWTFTAMPTDWRMGKQMVLQAAVPLTATLLSVDLHALSTLTIIFLFKWLS